MFQVSSCSRAAHVFAAVFLSGSFASAQPARNTVHVLANGVEVGGAYNVRVTALRNDILRITMTHAPVREPEEGSWAVLPEARAASAKVSDAGAAGFRTSSLAVHIGPDLQISVTDPQGAPMLEQAAPTTWTDKGFHVALRKHDDDHYFGLGDKPGPLDRAGEAFVMWNTDNFGWQESTDPIYKSIPFFIDFRAGRAAGVLLDNTFRTFFDFGREDQHRASFSAPDGPLTFYVLAGPDPKHVVESYAWLTGKSPLPPLWSLGFQQSRYSYETETRLMEVAHRLRSDRIPADALYLDIDYQEKNRPFTVDALKFPKFSEMVAELAREKFHLVVITDLHIAKLPDQGYAPYDSGLAGDHFVKNPDGSVFSGVVWPGPAVFPDFTQAASRAWWGTLYGEFAKEGVAGFWNDMNEPALFNVASKTMPDDVQHRIDEPGFQKRTATHLEIHNVYGMENTRGTAEGLLRIAPDVRPFVLTRASFAGGQRYSATWTGDNSATWNHLRMTTPQLLNLGLSGFAMAGADVGGFAGSPPADLLTKWIELAAFQPIDRDHSAKGTRDHEPWVDGPEQLAIRRRFIEERYRLMPYLYTVAEEMSRTGLPIIRPLFLEFPHATPDGSPLDLVATQEFLLGSRMLIAASPSPEEVAPYEVHLPPGGWYDFWTGEFHEGARAGATDLEQRDAVLAASKPLMITPKLEELPVYVRAGTILPMQPLVQSTEETPQGPLTLRVYAPSGAAATEPCEGSLYLDDGKSFSFRSGKLLRLQFSCTSKPDGSLLVHAATTTSGFAPWWTELRVEAYGWTPTRHEISAGGVRRKLEHAGPGWAGTVPAGSGDFDLTLR